MDCNRSPQLLTPSQVSKTGSLYVSTKFPLSHVSFMCSPSSFSVREEFSLSAPVAVRSYTTGSVLLELLLIEYQYKLSIFGMGQSHSVLRLRPFLGFTDTRRMPSMNLIPVGKTTGTVISHQLTDNFTKQQLNQ